MDGFGCNNSDSVLERDARGLEVETVMTLSLTQRSYLLWLMLWGAVRYAGKWFRLCARGLLRSRQTRRTFSLSSQLSVY